MRWLENITGGYSSSAKVISGTLVLSLPDAKSPIVWRMELDDIKAAAFEIKTGKDNDFILVMRTQEGDDREIAPFDNKAKALKALMAASRAMEQAHGAKDIVANDDGNVGSAASVHTEEKKSGSLIPGLIGILLLVGLIFFMTQLGPQASSSFNAGGAANTSGQASAQGAQGSPGVPVSADDFLRGR